MNTIGREAFSTKRFIIYTVTLAVTALLLGMVYVFAIKSHTKESTYQHLLEIAALYADDIDSKITGNMQTLIGVATIMGTYDTADTEAFTYALALENPKNSFDTMAYITADGIMHGIGATEADVSGEEFFKTAMAGTASYGFYDSAFLGGKNVTLYAVPLYHRGKIEGVLISMRGKGSYQELVEKPLFLGTGFVNVINKEGDILIRSSNANNAQDITNILSGVQFKDDREKQKMLSGLDGSLRGVVEYTVDGTDLMMAYAPIREKKSKTVVFDMDRLYATAIVPSRVANKQGDYIVMSTFILVCSSVAVIVLIFIQNTRKQRHYREKIENLAYFDQLTGIFNIIKFRLEAKKILASSGAKRFAIVKFDINNFKLINDIYGFSVGDEVLKNIASAIKTNLDGASNSIFARLANDDFAVMSSFTDDDGIRKASNHFIKLAAAACTIIIPNYTIDFSMGVCKWNGSDSPSIMLEKATMAQKVTKRLNGGGLMFYNDGMRNVAIKNKDIENTMWDALSRGEFVVYIQPKCDLRNGKIEGAEALVRWDHPEKGLIPPMEFIPLFEQNGFIVQIDLFVFEEVVKLQRKNMDLGRRIVPISVNQSAVLLNLPDYISRVDKIISKYDIPYSYIELELTETLFHDSLAYLNLLVGNLKGLGFGISIDDFGSGYSSLNMLKDIKADAIKLDRGFLRAYESSERGEIVLLNIIRMASELNMAVIAEGVETEKQAELLRGLNCGLAQGFLYAKPMPMTEFEEII